MIKFHQITPVGPKRLLITFSLIFIAAAMRLWPLQSLGTSMMWLTFYPAVMVISIYGGLWSGLMGTFLACLTVSTFWPMMVTQPFIKNPSDWLGLAVFVLTGMMISSVSEAMRYANHEARVAQQQAQRASKAKSIFLANMSHELRTPLNSILGYSQLMQDDASVSPAHREYLKIINRSGEHLLGLINEVLEISKIEASRVVFEPVCFNLHNLVFELHQMFKLKTDAKEILFNIQDISDLPKYVTTDETKLRIILINLIGNAVKFTNSGGITVRFSIQQEPSHQKFLLCEVEDSGPGIAAEEQDKLFQYFVQTESGKLSKSGTGLGLAISQDYAKLMGGLITVSSTLEVGSIFSVRIKIAEGTEGDSKIVKKHRQVIGLAAGQTIPRILVAEDHLENRNLLVKLLSSIGLEVREAADGLEAIQIVEQWKPQFIWMDIRMPNLDGLEATRTIKADESGKHIPIVALSAHVLANEKEEIFKAGCDDFLGKPYRKNEIFDLLQRHLGLEYIYQEAGGSEHEMQESSTRPLNLNHPGKEFIADLTVAVAHTDAIKIEELAQTIRLLHPEIAAWLHNCAVNFDYTTIKNALTEIASINTEETTV